MLDGLAKAAVAVEVYQLYHETALKLRQRGRCRPGYDEEHLLDEMEWRLKSGGSRSIPRAAIDIAATILDPEQDGERLSV